MPVACAICSTRDFSIVFESHHLIEEQPVIICFYCFKSSCYAFEEYCGEDAEKRIARHEASRESLQPKRCEHGISNADGA